MKLASNPTKTIFLADDDPDDRLLFQEALKQIDGNSNLAIAEDGEDLMNMLNEVSPQPQLIFIDMNMPRKNGFECLKEIRKCEKFKDIPVVVYSTSCQQDAIKKMYEHGASYYICKPDSFNKLIKSIAKIFSLDWSKGTHKPSMNDFIIAF